MKRLAIVSASVIIFTVAWSTANSQAELNKKYAETNNQIKTTQKHETNNVVDALGGTQAVEAIEDDKIPSSQIKTPVTAPETPTIQCGAQDPTLIFNTLRSIDVPRESAIQIMGSWKSESGGAFDYCQKIGDSGIAWGLNSWHPARRFDMPQTLVEQIKWAIQTEMKRDCTSCYNVIMTGGDVASIRSAIQRSTRWGTLGARWTYADEFSRIY